MVPAEEGAEAMKPTQLHRPPVPEVIAKLEELLESAKAGELQAVVVFESDDKRDVYTHWEGDMPLGDLLLAIELHRAKSVEKYLEHAGRIG